MTPFTGVLTGRPRQLHAYSFTWSADRAADGGVGLARVDDFLFVAACGEPLAIRRRSGATRASAGAALASGAALQWSDGDVSAGVRALQCAPASPQWWHL